MSEKKEQNTMHIWDQVSKTEVSHTKEVTFGRRFTAIDAHSQIMEATRLFGPIGSGWGYETEFGFHETSRGETYVFCDLTLWWVKEGQEWEGNPGKAYRFHFGPIRGMAVMQGIKAKTKPESLEYYKPSDNDAAKKAMTDALTKGLSHLGFNADVFLGKFDDNKYVAGLQKEQDEEASASDLAYQQDRKKFIDAIEKCKKPEQMDAVLENHKLWIAGLPAGTAVEMRSWVAKKKKEIK